jgi:chromosome segregation ATPase
MQRPRFTTDQIERRILDEERDLHQAERNVRAKEEYVDKLAAKLKSAQKHAKATLAEFDQVLAKGKHKEVTSAFEVDSKSEFEEIDDEAAGSSSKKKKAFSDTIEKLSDSKSDSADMDSKAYEQAHQATSGRILGLQSTLEGQKRRIADVKSQLTKAKVELQRAEGARAEANRSLMVLRTELLAIEEYERVEAMRQRTQKPDTKDQFGRAA